MLLYMIIHISCMLRISCSLQVSNHRFGSYFVHIRSLSHCLIPHWNVNDDVISTLHLSSLSVNGALIGEIALRVKSVPYTYISKRPKRIYWNFSGMLKFSEVNFRSLMTISLRVYYWVRWWKNCENRSTFALSYGPKKYRDFFYETRCKRVKCTYRQTFWTSW